MQADANFCTRCGKSKNPAISEVPSASVKEVRSKVQADVLRAEGITGQIEISGGVITITRKGFRATLSQGSKGEMTIPANQVTRIDYKKPTLLVNGHIHFVVQGETEHGHLNCPRTVIFRGREQEEAFEKLAELIERLKEETEVQERDPGDGVTREEIAPKQSTEAVGNNQVGSSAHCPHCGTDLDPAPKRKTKCPSCGKEVYVRKDSFDGQVTHYLKHEDALALDLVKDLGISEKALTEARKRGPAGRSLGDVVWGLISQQKQDAARTNDFQTISSLTRAQAAYWRRTGREYFHLEQEAMKAELRGYAGQGVTHVEILTSRDDRVCGKCKSLDGMVFTIQEAMEKMPLPVKCDDEESWCRCVYSCEMRRTK